MTTELWAIHVEGPDDLIAMPDKGTAEKRAASLNETWQRLSDRWRRALANETDESVCPRLRAVVVEWPHSPESHAIDVAAEGGDR